MSNFLTIFVALVAGFLCRRVKRFPTTTTAASLNAFVIYISLPTLILGQIPPLLSSTPIGPELLVPISMSWLLFGLSWLVFSQLGVRLGWKRQTIGALVLTAGLGNTSFVGFPLLEALIGPHAIPLGVLVDQPGTFLVVSTLGIFAAAFYSGRKVTAKALALRILQFPPFIALIIALLWTLAETPGMSFVSPSLARLAGTLVPLAVFAVGFQLHAKTDLLVRRLRELSLGLFFKLALAPAIFALVYALIFQQRGLAVQVTLLEAAMAPMITAAVIAAEFDLDTELANLMVGIGIPLSLITVPLLNIFFARFS